MSYLVDKHQTLILKKVEFDLEDVGQGQPLSIEVEIPTGAIIIQNLEKIG